MRDSRSLAPGNVFRRTQIAQRPRESARRRVNGEIGRVDAAELLRLWIDMNEGHARRGNIEQAIGLRWNFPEPPANQQQKIAVLHELYQLGIGVEAEIAGIARIERVEQWQTAIARRDRHVETLGEVAQGAARLLVPARSAKNEKRARRRRDQPLQFAHVFLARRGFHDAGGGIGRRANALFEHVLGQGQHDRTGAARAGEGESARDKFIYARRFVDFRDPFGFAAEHARDNRPPETPRGPARSARPGQ